jgi:hypothetical protein
LINAFWAQLGHKFGAGFFDLVPLNKLEASRKEHFSYVMFSMGSEKTGGGC